MTELYEKSLNKLELGAVLEQLADCAHSENAKEQCRKLLPLDDIEDTDLSEILPDKQARILIYCRTGRRSALAAAQLFDLGYPHLYDLGGLNGWPYGMEYGLL